MTKKEQPVGQEENKEREVEEAARGKSDEVSLRLPTVFLTLLQMQL